MIKCEMNFTMKQEEISVAIEGKATLDGHEVTRGELMSIARVLASVCAKLLPTLDGCPGNAVLDFVKELNRPFEEWAREH